MIGLIIQARMGSTRLPGKALKKVMGRPILAYQIERLQAVSNIDKLVVATTILQQDDPIIDLCEEMQIAYHRGSERDLLQRYLETALRFGFKTIVRSTGDCPLIDPKIVEKGVELFNVSQVDYLSNTLQRSYPRGMDVEIFSLEALEKADQCQDPALREHVTPPFYHSDQFIVSQFTDDQDNSHLRLTVDTQDDFSLVKKIFESLYPKNRGFSLKNILNILKKHPDWVKINQYIEQKKVGD